MLLLAPLARAALLPGDSLRERLSRVLTETTVEDAAEVYAAIRDARPGRAGRSHGRGCVGRRPTVTLREAMALAADRDAIAREYVTDFALTFEVGVPAIRRARQEGLTWTDASVEAYLTPAGCNRRTPTSHASSGRRRRSRYLSARARS